MDIALTPAQQDLRDRARTWLADHRVGPLSENHDTRFRQLREWQHQLYDAGWVGLGWPEAYGGQGGTALDQVIFNQELVHAKAPPPVGLVGLDVVGPTIIEFGTEAQKQTLVPALLRGDDMWCQGFSEPGAGSDLASLNTRAVRDGADFVVSGQKVWTSWAQHANRCALLVRTDSSSSPHRGITYLLADMDAPGISIRPLVQMTGDPEFSEVFFDDVRVPAVNVLGEIDEGWRVTMTTLTFERGPFSLRRQAEFRVALDDLAAQVQSASLATGTDDALLRRALGTCEMLVEVMGAQGFKTATHIAEGTVGPESSLDKMLLAEVEQTLFGTALDVLGADRTVTGIDTSVDAPRWIHDYLYSRAASIYGGSAEIQRNIVADRVLGLPRGSA